MSGGSFAHDIAGGGGNLIIAALQSPNFVAGSAGWQVTKAGAAEFNNVVVRSGEVIGGTTLTYSGNPATGNLIASVSGTPGTDAEGNAYLAGVTSYSPSLLAININNAVVTAYTAGSPAGPWTAAGGRLTLTALAVLAGHSVSIEGPLVLPLAAVQPGTTTTAETWHTGIGLNSFTLAPAGYQRFQYRLQPDGTTVEIAGCVQIPATFAGVTFFTLPAAYQPNAVVQWPYTTQQGLTVTSDGTGAVQVDTSGNMTLRNNPAGLASGNVIYVQGRFGLGTV